MRLTIGKETIDAEVVERDTYTSEKSKKELRELKVEFTIEGDDALDRFKMMETYASKRGIVSEDTLWKQETYAAQWKHSSPELGTNWYEAIWTLREEE